jgi:hypothetical protein
MSGSNGRFSQMSGDKKRLIVMLSVLAVLALLFVGKTVLGSSGGSSHKATPITASAPAGAHAPSVRNTKQSATTPTTAKQTGTAGSTSGTTEVTAPPTRDPFQPPSGSRP